VSMSFVPVIDRGGGDPKNQNGIYNSLTGSGLRIHTFLTDLLQPAYNMALNYLEKA